MSLQTKREVSHDLREPEQRQQRLSRLNSKFQGGQFKKSDSPKDSKILMIIKSSSSTYKHRLEALHSPSKRSPKFVNSHEDSDSSKSTTSSKMSFWGSPDLSPGIENLFNAMD